MSRNDLNEHLRYRLNEKGKHIAELQRQVSTLEDVIDLWKKLCQQKGQYPVKKKKPVVIPNYLRVI